MTRILLAVALLALPAAAGAQSIIQVCDPSRITCDSDGCEMPEPCTVYDMARFLLERVQRLEAQLTEAQRERECRCVCECVTEAVEQQSQDCDAAWPETIGVENEDGTVIVPWPLKPAPWRVEGPGAGGVVEPLLPGCEGGCIDYGVPGVPPTPIPHGWGDGGYNVPEAWHAIVNEDGTLTIPLGGPACITPAEVKP